MLSWDSSTGRPMEKSWRLQRYNRKDYSELVEFPVEIVGRDGVVRRYTFEDSIRLYRRRIIYAPIRYRDVELIQAEVDHCRSRIDQLRRSYFYRYGWGTPEGQPGPAEMFGTIAGELAAFICRVLRCEGRPEVQFEPIDGEAKQGVSTWYVVPPGATSGMILYVHRFDGAEADKVRESFFASVKAFERNGAGDGDNERLIAFHHTVDCGFVLTGRGHEFDAYATPADEDEVVPGDATPWDEALEIIRRGEFQEGLARCRELVTAQPWHRSGYVAGAVLAAHLELPLEAEDFALVGSRYFPEDAVLQFYVGLARARQQRRADALEPLRTAVTLDPGLTAARLLLVVLLLQSGRDAEALDALDRRFEARPDDRRTLDALDRLAKALFWRRVVAWAGYGAAGLGLCATLLAGWFGLAPVLAGLGLSGVSLYWFDRELDHLGHWSRLEDITQGLRRIRRRHSGDGVVS